MKLTNSAKAFKKLLSIVEPLELDPDKIFDLAKTLNIVYELGYKVTNISAGYYVDAPSIVMKLDKLSMVVAYSYTRRYGLYYVHSWANVASRDVLERGIEAGIQDVLDQIHGGIKDGYYMNCNCQRCLTMNHQYKKHKPSTIY